MDNLREAARSPVWGSVETVLKRRHISVLVVLAVLVAAPFAYKTTPGFQRASTAVLTDSIPASNPHGLGSAKASVVLNDPRTAVTVAFSPGDAKQTFDYGALSLIRTRTNLAPLSATEATASVASERSRSQVNRSGSRYFAES